METNALERMEDEEVQHECFDCKESFSESEMEEYEEGWICGTCRDAYNICDECNKLVLQDDSHTDGSTIYCKSCWDSTHFRCDWCRDWYHNDDLSPYEGESFCRGCYDDQVRSCVNCGYEGRVDNMYWSDRREEWYCCDCHNEDDDEIHDHGYNPGWTLHRVSPIERGLGYGIELGVEVPDEMNRDNLIEEMHNKFGRGLFIVKNDGSLEHGMEIVTHPMTYEFFQSQTQKFSEILKFLRNQDCKSYETSTCGIHIHITKEEISHLIVYKILKLFYENPGFILKISQRRVEKFEEWCKLHRKGENADETNLYNKAKYKSGMARYVAVNLNNRDTIEFRVFRGTLHEPSFLKNVEFIRSVVEFCEATNIPEITTLRYLLFVKERQKEYKNLAKFLTNKNLWRREEHVYRNSADQEQDNQ